MRAPTKLTEKGMRMMSESRYVVEPHYCGDCISFQNENEGYGNCLRYDEEAWQGDIGCGKFKEREDEEDE